jgi:hypothetical protein
MLVRSLSQADLSFNFMYAMYLRECSSLPPAPDEAGLSLGGYLTELPRDHQRQISISSILAALTFRRVFGRPMPGDEIADLERKEGLGSCHGSGATGTGAEGHSCSAGAALCTHEFDRPAAETQISATDLIS